MFAKKLGEAGMHLYSEGESRSSGSFFSGIWTKCGVEWKRKIINTNGESNVFHLLFRTEIQGRIKMNLQLHSIARHFPRTKKKRLSHSFPRPCDSLWVDTPHQQQYLNSDSSDKLKEYYFNFSLSFEITIQLESPKRHMAAEH